MWSAHKCFATKAIMSMMSSLSDNDMRPASPRSNSKTFASPEPLLSAFAPSPVTVLTPSASMLCLLHHASRKNCESSIPLSRARGSPSASSYSIMSSGGKLANFRPSSTSAACNSSDKSSHANVGLGPAAQLTLPVEPRKTGKIAERRAALKVDAARIVCSRSPRTGNTEKNSSSFMPLKITCEQQWLISSCMAPAMTPSSNILFQLLSKVGSRSPSSGRGSDFLEDKRAKPP
mmetsp:Transcript_20448/g.59283  ORF Transcript_20448/g.59283 Transcript_20448/m.59283 type:complete len:233 (-) Transcript_20448:947-1645(-)